MEISLILFVVFLIIYGLWVHNRNTKHIRKLAAEDKRKYPSLYNRDGTPREY